ncbi:uncharacterized protein DFL_007799 [Arthrobotrys flagrans]|uniref:Uncharacterized protein n=1 Tax=Arthrobotrys flagrans TaxID=97331 RepID=A0A436ZX85_ARTFL|nr:hypothetical protein DFL_007799 [Arthrobotrys flagrans]
MSRYLPATPRIPTHLLSTSPIPLGTAHSHLQSYLLSTASSQPWSHSHDAGTTASLKKLELSLRGIHGPSANSHFVVTSPPSEIDNLEDTFSKPDTDEGGESERQRVYETVEDLEVAEEIRDEDEGIAMRELQSVERREEGEEDVEMLEESEKKVVDKEERKRLKKIRMKEEKKRKEAERAAERE